jgi:hypothetical protein
MSSRQAVKIPLRDFVFVLAANLDLPVVPCPTWISFNGTLQRLQIFLGFLLLSDFQMVVINEPSVLSPGIFVDAISFCNNVYHQIFNTPVVKKKKCVSLYV